MGNIGHFQVPHVTKQKKKKKKVKDELDRLKQAEKKKRRLEKALATSAAIRAELEKKKQKKKEQERLDEEGAAIAEAVALNVLLGEDSDDSHKIILEKEGFNSWDYSGYIGSFRSEYRAGVPYQGFTKYSLEGLGWVSDTYGYACNWNEWGVDHVPYIGERGPEFEETSEGLIAAQAVSSLQIVDDACVDNHLQWKLEHKLRSFSNKIHHL